MSVSMTAVMSATGRIVSDRDRSACVKNGNTKRKTVKKKKVEKSKKDLLFYNVISIMV